MDCARRMAHRVQTSVVSKLLPSEVNGPGRAPGTRGTFCGCFRTQQMARKFIAFTGLLSAFKAIIHHRISETATINDVEWVHAFLGAPGTVWGLRCTKY
jgi:hypothetical protein